MPLLSARLGGFLTLRACLLGTQIGLRMKRGGTLLFLKEGLKHYRECGTLLPSSPRLAKAITKCVPQLTPDEVILELGAGTGVVTKQLRERFPKNKIVSVEINGEFCKKLKKEFPDVIIVESCASKVEEVLRDLGVPNKKVAAVVSGLPFVSIPEELRPRIWSAIARVLEIGKPYIQFSYIAAYWKKLPLPGFEREKTRKVWTNIPPASVFTFKRVVHTDKHMPLVAAV